MKKSVTQWIRDMNPWNGFKNMALIVRLQFIILRNERDKNHYFVKNVVCIKSGVYNTCVTDCSIILHRNHSFKKRMLGLGEGYQDDNMGNEYYNLCNFRI